MRVGINNYIPKRRSHFRKSNDGIHSEYCYRCPRSNKLTVMCISNITGNVFKTFSYKPDTVAIYTGVTYRLEHLTLIHEFYQIEDEFIYCDNYL